MLATTPTVDDVRSAASLDGNFQVRDSPVQAPLMADLDRVPPQLTEAVHVALAAGTPSEVRAKAEAFCAEFREHPNAWRVCCSSLLTLDAHGDVELQYFFAQTLAVLVRRQRDLDRGPIRRFLKLFVSSVVCATPACAATVVVTRVAGLYAQCCFLDYPGAWPGAFADLFERVSGSAYSETAAKFMLSVMEALHEEGIALGAAGQAQEGARALEVKDSLRQRDIIHCMQSMLEIFHRGDGALGSRAAIVAAHAVLWADVHVFANKPFCDAMLAALKNSQPASAALFIAAVFRKRMDPMQKFVIAYKLDLLVALVDLVRATLSGEKQADGSPAEVVYPSGPLLSLAGSLSAVAWDLVDALLDLRKGFEHAKAVTATEVQLRAKGGVAAAGENPYFTPIETLEVWHEVQRAAQGMLLNTLFPAVLLAFQDRAFHQDLAKAALDGMHAVLKLLYNLLRPERGRNPPLDTPLDELRPFVRASLEACVQRAQVPPALLEALCEDAAADDADPDLTDFLDFRDDVVNLFKRAFALQRTSGRFSTYKFVEDFLLELAQALASVDARSTEQAQHLLVTMLMLCISVDSVKEPREVTPESPLIAAFRVIVSSDAARACCSRPAVRRQMCQMIAKFSKVLRNATREAQRPDVVKNILLFFLGPWGIKQETGAIHALLKFIRSDSAMVADHSHDVIAAFDSAGLLSIARLGADACAPRVGGDGVEGPAPLPFLRSTASGTFIKCAGTAPHKAPGQSYTFEDQNKCFEVIGHLLYYRKKDPAALEATLAVLAPLLSKFHLSSPYDELSADCASRAMGAVAAFSRGFAPDPGFARAWAKTAAALEAALMHDPFGVRDARARIGVNFVLRRLIAVTNYRKAPSSDAADLVPRLARLMSIVFTSAAAAAAIVLVPAAATRAAAFAAGPNSVRWSVHAAPAYEICQGLACLSFALVTTPRLPDEASLPGACMQPFLAVPYITTGDGETTAAKELLTLESGIPSLGITPEAPLPCTVGCLLRAFEVAKMIEGATERAEVLRDFYHTLNLFISNAGDAILNLLSADSGSDGAKFLTNCLNNVFSVCNIAASNANGSTFAIFAPPIVGGLNAWVAFLLAVFKRTAAASTADTDFSSEVVQFLSANFDIGHLFCGLFFAIRNCNAADPQQRKMAVEFVTLVRLFHGSLPNVPALDMPQKGGLPNPAGPLATFCAQHFVSALRSSGCVFSADAGDALLSRIKSAPTPRDAETELFAFMARSTGSCIN